MSTGAPELKSSVTDRLILLGAIITLGNLADIIHKSSRVYLFQQAQCLLYYKYLDPTVIKQDFSIDEALCKVTPVQSHLATIIGVDSFLSFLPRESRLTLVIYAASVTSPKKSPFRSLIFSPIDDAKSVSLTVALLLLAPYTELLPRMGLRRLVLLNIACSGLEVLHTVLIRMASKLFFM